MRLKVTCTKCANEVETRIFKPESNKLKWICSCGHIMYSKTWDQMSLEEKEKALTT